MIVPAGHGAREDVVPDLGWKLSDLERALQRIIKIDMISYDICNRILSGLDPDPREAQLLVQRYGSDANDAQVRLFLNSVYSLTRKKYVHHFACAKPISSLGGDISSDKLLYVSVPSDFVLGWKCNGVIVSSASTDRWAGSGMGESGVLIQAAPSEKLFGEGSRGLCVALEEPESYGDNNNGLVVRHDEVSGDLRSYCDSLVDICNTGEDAVYREFGDCPATTIRKNIYDLVDWHPEGWCG